MRIAVILDVALTDAAAYKEYDSEEENPEHHHEHEHHEHEHHEHEHHHHEHHHHHSEHLQNDGFVSVSFESDRPFAVKKFETFLTEEVSTAVFRAKGILWFQESEARHVFQLSGPRYDLNQEDWLEPPKTQLVLIGRNLDSAKIKAQLTACLV